MRRAITKWPEHRSTAPLISLYLACIAPWSVLHHKLFHTIAPLYAVTASSAPVRAVVDIVAIHTVYEGLAQLMHLIVPTVLKIIDLATRHGV